MPLPPRSDMSSVTAPDTGWRPPRWAWPVSLVLTLLGLAVAAYLTDAHFNESVQLACPDSGTINCAKVTTSDQSYIFGAPVAVLGLAYFFGLTLLMLPQAWRVTAPWMRWGRLLAVLAGMGTVVWLVYAELFIIDAICLYCTAIHVINFLLLVVVALATVWTPIDADDYLDDDEDDDELTDDELTEAGPA